MSYNIPRDVKGEGRILYIFSYKALGYTAIGIGIGALIYTILSAIGLDIIGYIVIGILGFIGFGIGTFKLPDIKPMKSARLAAGEKIDDVIRRAIAFKMRKDKYYVYIDETKEENKVEGGKKDGLGK